MIKVTAKEVIAQAEDTKLIQVVNADETGAYVFDTGEVSFWTSGRGGYVVEGGLGVYTDNPDWQNRWAELNTIADRDLASDSSNIQFTDIEGLWELPPDLMGKAQQAHQSPGGKYDLSSYITNEEL